MTLAARAPCAVSLTCGCCAVTSSPMDGLRYARTIRPSRAVELSPSRSSARSACLRQTIGVSGSSGVRQIGVRPRSAESVSSSRLSSMTSAVRGDARRTRPRRARFRSRLSIYGEYQTRVHRSAGGDPCVREPHSELPAGSAESEPVRYAGRDVPRSFRGTVGVTCTITTDVTFAADGSSASGLETLSCSNSSSSCTSTYRFTATRQ